MPLDYDPEDAVTAWPEGDYDAVLKRVEDKTSKVKADGSGGNPMQVWTFDAYQPDGRNQEVTEYVVIPAATFKIKHLARALGKEADFKAGNFQAEQHLGANVNVHLTVEQQEGFDEKNRISRYNSKPANGNGATAAQPYPQTRDTLKSKPAAQRPFGDEQQFTEDSIPF